MKLFKFYSWCLGVGLILAGGMWLSDFIDNKFLTAILVCSLLLLWAEAGMLVLRKE